MPKLLIQRGRSVQKKDDASGANSLSVLMNLKGGTPPLKTPNSPSSKTLDFDEDDEELVSDDSEALSEGSKEDNGSDLDDDYVFAEEDEDHLSEDEEENYDDDEDYDRKTRTKRKITVQHAKRKSPRVLNKGKYKHSDDDEDDEDDSDTEFNKPTHRVRVSRSSARTFTSSDDHEESQEDETPTRRSSRSTAKRAKALIAAAVAEDDEIFDEDMEERDNKRHTSHSKRKSNKPHVLVDDNWRERPSRKSSSTMQKMNIGDADSVSFDESSGSEISPKKIFSPTLNLTKSSETSWIRSPSLPPCTSTHDCITMEALPRIHVCYRTPDNRSYHCFALETLYKAAIMPGLKRYKVDGKLAFLQPPHFRTVIDGNLEDQIASRFGRRALNIEESSIYLSNENISCRRDDDEHAVSFEDRLSKYLTNLMGSGDLYCCPLCYAEAHQRFLGQSENDDTASDEDSDPDHHSYEALLSTVTATKVDPMSILGSLDDDEFQVASTFCFRKLTDVKAHLTSVHEVKLKGLDASNLLKNFKIRDQDGLLQRHLMEYYHGRVRSTSMRSYWTEEGNDRSYIFLRSLIELRENGGDEDKDDAYDFCCSFPTRAKKMWSSLSAPFEKGTGDVQDFIDDDNFQDDMPVKVFEKPRDLEEDIIQALRKKTKGTTSSSESNEEYNDYHESSEETEEFEVLSVDEDSDEGSEEDSWYEKKRSASKRKRPNESLQSRKTPPLRKLKKNDTDSDDEEILMLDHTPSGLLSSADSRKRRILDDD